MNPPKPVKDSEEEKTWEDVSFKTLDKALKAWIKSCRKWTNAYKKICRNKPTTEARR